MKLNKFEKTYSGEHLKHYQLTYENKAGNPKVYEIVSRSEYQNVSQLSTHVDGVSIVALKKDKLLLLKEFRLGINKSIYNLCAGLKLEHETMEECIKRELYEETGLHVKQIIDILPPSYAAVAISDVLTSIAIVTIEEDEVISDHTSDNEEISAAFYTREEVAALLNRKQFSSRAQTMAYFFEKGLLSRLVPEN